MDQASYGKEPEDWIEVNNAYTLVTSMTINKNVKNLGSNWKRQKKRKPQILDLELLSNKEIFKYCRM